MEVPHLPLADASETEAIASLEDQDMVRIAFELWQRGSLPELAEETEPELEEVACHASCL